MKCQACKFDDIGREKWEQFLHLTFKDSTELQYKNSNYRDVDIELYACPKCETVRMQTSW